MRFLSYSEFVTRYNADYFERGVELGCSGYQDYRWLPDLTIPMCRSLADYVCLSKSDSVLDYGCAKGFIVRALCELGYDAYGVDISEYAIKNADPSVVDRLRLVKHTSEVCHFGRFDWIVSKDVLEHVSYEEIGSTIHMLSRVCSNAFIIVPLGDGKKYRVPEYEFDETHVIREDEDWWISMFEKNGFIVRTVSMRVKGIKDNWSHVTNGNLFLTLISKN